MIASFRHRFVFLKTRKTAGTSVEIALSQLCGPEDVVAPIALDDEQMRLRDGVVAARNYVDDPAIVEAYTRAILARDEAAFGRARGRNRRAGGFYNHMPAAEIRAKLPRDFWDGALKITVERHPYEKVVSRAFFELGKGTTTAPLHQVLDQHAREAPEDLDIYCIDGQVVADEILRHETLAADLERVCVRLGVAAPPLQRAKASHRSDRRPAREILSAGQKELILQRHRRTFELLGYER